jgi:hypothetical protein
VVIVYQEWKNQFQLGNCILDLNFKLIVSSVIFSIFAAWISKSIPYAHIFFSPLGNAWLSAIGFMIIFKKIHNDFFSNMNTSFVFNVTFLFIMLYWFFRSIFWIFIYVTGGI